MVLPGAGCKGGSEAGQVVRAGRAGGQQRPDDGGDDQRAALPTKPWPWGVLRGSDKVAAQQWREVDRCRDGWARFDWQPQQHGQQ